LISAACSTTRSSWCSANTADAEDQQGKGGGGTLEPGLYGNVRRGGIARGKVVGKTDSIGGTVADRPISPKDLLATIYHLLATTSKPL